MGEKLTKTSEIIEHKGVQILLNDFSGLKGQEIGEAIKATSKAMIPKTANKRDWTCINIYRNCVFDAESQKTLMKIHKIMAGFFIAWAL
jgi:hypothetical protein